MHDFSHSQASFLIKAPLLYRYPIHENHFLWTANEMTFCSHKNIKQRNYFELKDNRFCNLLINIFKNNRAKRWLSIHYLFGSTNTTGNQKASNFPPCFAFFPVYPSRTTFNWRHLVWCIPFTTVTILFRTVLFPKSNSLFLNQIQLRICFLSDPNSSWCFPTF